MINLETLTNWGPPKELQTKYGPRILRKATPDQTFWAFWAKQKDELKSLGLSVSKDLQTGSFQVCWWSKLGESETAKREANLEASRAAQSDFEPPCPEGLSYMPFQKAGIEYCCRIMGIDISQFKKE